MTAALVIINEHSRSGAEHRERVLELLGQAGIRTVSATAAAPADIPRLIEAHQSEVDAVILGGGDGTLQCAASALAGRRLRLGILPLGTANDLARTLALPADLEQACRIIADGNTRAIDMGCVNGRHFFNVANIGLGAEVKRILTRDSKAWWGALSYARAALDAHRRQAPFQAVIEAEGRVVSVQAIQIAVGNGVFYGGGMAVHETARIDDGRLDLYALPPKRLWELAGMGPWLKRGRLSGMPGVVQIGAREIQVSTAHPMPITADGEVISATPARFSVLPGAVDVYVQGSAGNAGLPQGRKS